MSTVAGKLGIDEAEFSLDELLSYAVAMFMPQAQAAGPSLSCSMGGLVNTKVFGVASKA